MKTEKEIKKVYSWLENEIKDITKELENENVDITEVLEMDIMRSNREYWVVIKLALEWILEKTDKHLIPTELKD